MALKQILLRKKLETLTAQMRSAEESRGALIERRNALMLREEELEKAVAEVTEETAAEEQEALDEETAKWEADEEALAKEEGENAETTRQLQEQIDALQAELNELDSRSQMAAQTPEKEERKVEKTMNTRKFFGMNMQERDAFFAREDVKKFLGNVRSAINEKRSISGAEATIPTAVMDLVREQVMEYSKLLKHVNLQRISGDARVPVMGVIPDAVWTEMCGELNELELTIGQVTMDGYKVGAYVAVCNAVLEDNDVDLAAKVIEAIAIAMGRAIDKAILYGTGTKMPTGIMTALLASEYAATNVVAVTGATGIELYQAIIEAIGATDNEYAHGEMFFAMNGKTKTTLMANAMGFNAAGALVSGQGGEMPVVGGKIETLGFIPDDVIIGGYGELYPMLERAGMTFARSEHVRFIQDQTVFKGAARYDGKPVIAKGFVAIGIGGTKPSASGVTFE